MRVHVESWCPETDSLMLPPYPCPGKPKGVLASEGHLALPSLTLHLFQLFEIVCVKVKVQFSNKRCRFCGPQPWLSAARVREKLLGPVTLEMGAPNFFLFFAFLYISGSRHIP